MDYLYTPVQEKYRTAKWGQEEERTATNSHIQKTYSVNKSTELGSHSPYRSTAVSRLEEARKAIDEVIVDISEKRDMNDEALREVRSVNSEIIEDYRKNQFHYDNKENYSKSTASYTREPRSAHASACRTPPQDDALQLRSRLNDQIRKNNELMIRLSRVEQENKLFKREQQLSFGPAGNQESLRAENEHLKTKLSQIMNLPSQILSEIEDLKRENQQLRGDTVKLLRRQQYI